MNYIYTFTFCTLQVVTVVKCLCTETVVVAGYDVGLCLGKSL